MLHRYMLHDEFRRLEQLVALFTSVLVFFFLFDHRRCKPFGFPNMSAESSKRLGERKVKLGGAVKVGFVRSWY